MYDYSINGLAAKKKRWFARKKKPVKEVKAVAGKTPVTTEAPKKMSARVEGFTARYLYPVELIDSPRAWMDEHFYFGETPTMYLSAEPSIKPAEKPKWYETAFTTAVGIYQQKQALKQAQQENALRMQQGLPPISTSEIKRQFAPQVEVGISPQVRNILLFGGLGAGAFVFINMLQKRRAT